MLQSRFAKVVLAVVLAGVPVVALGYMLYPGGVVDGRFRPTRERYLLAQGLHAVGQKDFLKARECASALEDRGYDNALHLLRGKILLEEAKVATRKQRPPEDYLVIQRAAQMVLAGAAAPSHTAVVRGPAWYAAGLVQTPVTVPVPLWDGCTRALSEVAQVQDDGEIGDKATLVAGECLYVLRKYGLAEEGLKALVKRDPKNLMAHYFLSQIYIRFENGAAAKPHLRAWGELDPRDGIPYRWLGYYERLDPKTNELTAIEDYREALRRTLTDSMRAEVVEELALALRAKQAWDNALEVLDQCPKQYRDKPQFLILRDQLLLNRNRPDEAVQALEDVLSRDPGNRTAMILLGNHRINQGKLSRAQSLLEASAGVDPYDRTLQAALVRVYSMLENKAKSAQEKQAYEDKLQREKALQDETQKLMLNLNKMQTEAKKNPNDVRIRYELAMKALSINHYREARQWLEAAVAINPNHRQATTALSQLAALTSFEPRVSGR